MPNFLNIIVFWYFNHYKVWCDVLSHYRSKIKYTDYSDIWVYATDVFFNKYPEYTLSCGIYNASIHSSDRRIIRALSSLFIKNAGVTTTKINSAPQYFLTDVEEFQRIYILWINRFYPYLSDGDKKLIFSYTTDRNVTITDYNDSYWFVIREVVSIPKSYVIHNVSIAINTYPSSYLRIYTNPYIDIPIRY